MEIDRTARSSDLHPDRTTLLRSQLDALRRSIPDKEISVVRDPQSDRFVVQVLDTGTGKVIDQFPSESILKVLSRLITDNGKPE